MLTPTPVVGVVDAVLLVFVFRGLTRIRQHPPRHDFLSFSVSRRLSRLMFPVREETLVQLWRFSFSRSSNIITFVLEQLRLEIVIGKHFSLLLNHLEDPVSLENTAAAKAADIRIKLTRRSYER